MTKILLRCLTVGGRRTADKAAIEQNFKVKSLSLTVTLHVILVRRHGNLLFWRNGILRFAKDILQPLAASSAILLQSALPDGSQNAFCRFHRRGNAIWVKVLNIGTSICNSPCKPAAKFHFRQSEVKELETFLFFRNQKKKSFYNFKRKKHAPCGSSKRIILRFLSNDELAKQTNEVFNCVKYRSVSNDE